MNLRDIQYIVAVADLRNFSQAAQQCNISQPTLSAQIKKMEEWLGIKIFERTNRRVMLTDTGELIIQSARRILHEVDIIHDVADMAYDPFAGKFRLGAFPTLATYIFPDMVPQISAAMPKLKLILIEEKTAILLERLKQGEIDAALIALPIHEDYLESIPLFDDEFYLAVPPTHPLAKEKIVDQEMLKHHELLLLDEGHCLRDQALDICQMHDLKEDKDFRATGLETLRQMVKAGTGITFMPKLAMRKNEEGICYIPFRNPAPRRTIGLVWRKTSVRKPVLDDIITMFRLNKK